VVMLPSHWTIVLGVLSHSLYLSNPVWNTSGVCNPDGQCTASTVLSFEKRVRNCHTCRDVHHRKIAFHKIGFRNLLRWIFFKWVRF
jgi:hypothetical protein